MSKESTIGLWVSIIAGVFGVFGVFWSVYIYWEPLDDKLTNSRDFLGIWQTEYSYKITNGTTTVRGTTEYFKSGMYNFTGVIINSMSNHLGTVKVMYDVDGAGTWKNDANNLYITLADSKSYPRHLEVDGKQIDLNEHIFREIVPKLELFLPKNTSEQYLIVEKNSKKITFELDDPFGKNFPMVIWKVDKKYQRQ